jgi:hypothetical protein
VHGCNSPKELDLILNEFSICSRYADALSCVKSENGTAAIVTLDAEQPAEIGFSWPTSRDTLNHDTISYVGSRDTHEIVDLYLASYLLSMMSRYYPDIWVAFIESQCRGAKLAERTMEIFIKKFPMLVLSMLGSEPVVVSTHRETWLE